MPFKSKAVKNKGKIGKETDKNTEQNDKSNVRTRSKSQTNDDVKVSDPLEVSMTSQQGNAKTKRKSEPIALSKSKVARKIDFSEVKSPMTGTSGDRNALNEPLVTTNNNAKPSKALNPKMKQSDYAQSNPKVFDNSHIFNDGVDINVDPAEENEFGDEYGV